MPKFYIAREPGPDPVIVEAIQYLGQKTLPWGLEQVPDRANGTIYEDDAYGPIWVKHEKHPWVSRRWVLRNEWLVVPKGTLEFKLKVFVDHVFKSTYMPLNQGDWNPFENI